MPEKKTHTRFLDGVTQKEAKSFDTEFRRKNGWLQKECFMT